MKLNEVKPLTEASFTPKNFPEEGNEDFSGVGERTNYVDSEKNDNEGFSLTKNVKVVVPGESERVELEKGTKVHITRPGELVRGRDIGANPPGGVFTQISKHSPEQDDALGYVLISNIEKPAGAQQSRMSTGAESQNAIAEKLKEMFGDDYEFVSTAKKGSTVPDLVVKVEGTEIQFEIKGANTPTAPITFFDKSVRRDQAVPLLDNFAQTLSGGTATTFTELVDQYREQERQQNPDQEPEIGFPGDEGTPKSGKLPKDFQITNDPQMLAKLREDILEHFAAGGDNYFAIHIRPKDDVSIYHTGHGPNPLNSDPLPALEQFKLATYGGPSAGAMRAGIKIKLAKQ